MMEPVTLHRIDPSRNMARFYRLVLQPDLFGGCSLVREWGRIGFAGQVRATAFPSADLAEAAQVWFLRAKERRGYQHVSAIVH
jgi:predicted DNA-binding WGR domain protein